MTYRIFCYSESDKYPTWRDSQEGPFGTREAAIEFAHNECGVARVVVDEQNIPQAWGDSYGVQGRVPVSPCPSCGNIAGNEAMGARIYCEKCSMEYGGE
jgi:hypothetical protein